MVIDSDGDGVIDAVEQAMFDIHTTDWDVGIMKDESLPYLEHSMRQQYILYLMRDPYYHKIFKLISTKASDTRELYRKLEVYQKV